jgi:hypothetical protein
MGMTDELSVSHYFRRLTAIEQTFGDAESHIEQFRGFLPESSCRSELR